MTWQCRQITFKKGMNLQDNSLKVGDMFYAPEVDSEDYTTWLRFNTKHLSEYYYQNNAHRRPVLVVLPGPTLFCVDSKCMTKGEYYGGWTVTGEIPNITVSPSINLSGTYHGFLQNGIIGDEVEGRKYNEQGYQI